MQKTTIPIAGMHCRSCELLIENEVAGIPGVCKVEANQSKSQAVIYHDSNRLDWNAVSGAIQKSGYEIGIDPKKPWFSRNIDDYLDLFYAVVALGVLYFLVDVFDLTKLVATNASQPTSLGAVLLIGLTAGFSTCMALIGGLVLGVSARFAEINPDASSLARFRPHLWFNLGRILSYAFLGGVIGLLGATFQLSGYSLGIMTLAVALVMLTLGLQLTNLFPRLENFKITLPSFIAKSLGLNDQGKKAYSDKNSFMMGASTFFLPCGFTQAMQLYAMSTGSFAAGAVIMALFAIGTAPGLLGVGGLTAALKGVFAQKFFKFAGVIVILLSFFNARNGLNLMGVVIPALNPVAEAKATDNKVLGIAEENGYQILRMDQVAGGYVPNKLSVVKGKPVKWIITSKDPYSCAASILATKIGVRANLKPGENVFTFTPKEVGTINFSCSMGMYRGSISVVEPGQAEKIADPVDDGGIVEGAQVVAGEEIPKPAGSCGSGGCGCGGGARKAPAAPQETPTSAITQAGVQVIKTTYKNVQDISPSVFEVKANQPVRLEIKAEDDGVGCMSSVMVLNETEPVLLRKGKTITFEFTPKKKGDLLITCAMGMPRGLIKVI